MRHANKNRKLNRPTDQRMQMLSDIVSALFLQEKITTTLARAKEARRMADHFVGWGKAGTVAAKRKIYSFVKNRSKVKMICDKSVSRYADRQSGFTRIVRVGYRRGDSAPLVQLELV